MLREPGPIPPLNTSWYPTTYDTPDFTAEVEAAFSSIDSSFYWMDAIFDPTAVLDDLPTGDTIMTDLEAVDKVNGSNAHLAVTDPIANIDQFKASGDAALTAAIQVIPGEAFTPVPMATQYGTQPQVYPTANIKTVTITNSSGVPVSNFAVGDQFQIFVQMDTTTGHANDYFQVQLYAQMTKDGVQQPNQQLPQTDQTGSSTFTGVWQSTDTGNWQMAVFAQPFTGGQVEYSYVTWSVGAQRTQTGPPAAAAVKVTLINWTSGNLANNHSGDTWQLFVSGPANADVYLWPTHNGVALSEATLGQTDSFGNFNLAGKWADTEIGDWVEQYGVGHFLQLGNTTFTVKAAGAP